MFVYLIMILHAINNPNTNVCKYVPSQFPPPQILCILLINKQWQIWNIVNLIVLPQAINNPNKAWKQAPSLIIYSSNAFAYFWGSNKNINKILHNLLCYPREARTQTKHEHKHHHYLLTFHSSCIFFWESNHCINNILYTILLHPIQSITQEQRQINNNHLYLFVLISSFVFF